MIDVTKCFGCRKGIGLFIKEKKGFVHLDLFATYEHGNAWKQSKDHFRMYDPKAKKYYPDYLAGNLEFELYALLYFLDYDLKSV